MYIIRKTGTDKHLVSFAGSVPVWSWNGEKPLKFRSRAQAERVMLQVAAANDLPADYLTVDEAMAVAAH